MKKINYLVSGLLVMLALAASSCEKTDNDFVEESPTVKKNMENGNGEDDGLVNMEFGAYTSSGRSGTRSTLTENNGVSWTSGDKITIFDAVAPREFVASEGGQYAKFTGKAKKSSVYYALYPYQSGVTMGDGVIHGVTLPSAQAAVAGTYSNNISVACSSDMNLYFKNIVSLVKLSINSDNAGDIRKITLNTSVVLAGKIDIAFDGSSTPYVSSVSGESTSVSIESASGFTKGAAYYMAVLPASVTGGFSITFESKDGKDFTKEYAGDSNMDRSRIFSLGDVTVEFLADPVAENEPFSEVSAVAIPSGVDLGLSSGNIWSEFYYGASSDSEYGTLVGIGDPTGTATAFNDPAPYFHSNDVAVICGTEHDIIACKWGNGWQLPTMADLNELKDACTWEHNVEKNGVKGSVATGPNGNKLFFAYAGIRTGDKFQDQGDHASIWTGEVGGTWNNGYPGYYDLDIFASGTFKTDGSTAWTGQSARGVRKPAVK